MEHLPGFDRCLVIGEVGIAHDGSLGTAHAFIDAIADAGAGAVKFQTHIAAAESTPAEPFRVKFSRQDATRYAFWQRLEFTPAQWAGLADHARDRNLLFLSSPFSAEAVALLRGIGQRVWKIASGEVSNLPLLRDIAAGGDLVLLSSGMSGYDELDGAVAAVRECGAPVAVMQCTTQYPCPPERVGLNLLAEFRERYHAPVGLSDHSGTIYPSIAAVAFGAAVVEVHVTLSRQSFGPDVPASLTPAELRQLVDGVDSVERMLAHPMDKNAAAAELAPLHDIFTKSVVARIALPAGTVLGPEHLALKKPGTGIPAARVAEVEGRRLRRAVDADHLLSFEDFEETP